MEFKELTAELEKFKDTEEFNNYVGGFITPDRVTKYLETEDGKKIVRPLIDSNFSKGLETWKQNNLSKLVEEEYKKKFPDADPKDLEMKKLQDEINNIKRDATRKELTNKALKVATQKKLPVDLIDYFIGEDEDTTLKNLDKFEKTYTSSMSALVDEKMKSTSHTPAVDNKNNNNTDPFLQGLGL